ncbi:MAG: peptidylprolyl isomerase [Cardiobacteriaceae bacterium]|nr:peptidylprolyl isomerase [Cardiobacteriaceae bacterium]
MKISKNSVVELSYELFDDKGQAIIHDGEPITYLHGDYGGTFPKVESALEGKAVGDEIDITLTPDEHFGEVQEDFIRREPRNLLPEEIEVGMVLEGEDAHGHIQLFTINDINENEVILNGNHPLAGFTLRFKAKVQNIRPANADEIAHGHVHGPHDHHHH